MTDHSDQNAAVASLREISRLLREEGKLDLFQRLLDVQQQLVQLGQENLGLANELANLKAQLKFSTGLKFVPPFYFADQDPTPYCANCWEAKRVAVHLVDTGPSSEGLRFECTNCNKVFFDKNRGRIE